MKKSYIKRFVMLSSFMLLFKIYATENPMGNYYPKVIAVKDKFYVFYLNSDRFYAFAKKGEAKNNMLDLFYNIYSKEGQILEYHKKYYNGNTPKFIWSILYCALIRVDSVNYYSYADIGNNLYLSPHPRTHSVYGQVPISDEKNIRIYKKNIDKGSMEFINAIKNRRGFEYPNGFLDDAKEILIPKRNNCVVEGLLVDKDYIIITTVNTTDNTLSIMMTKNGKVEKNIEIGKVNGNIHTNYKVFSLLNVKSVYALFWLEQHKEEYSGQIKPTNLNITLISKEHKKAWTFLLKEGVLSNAFVSAATIDDAFLVAYSESLTRLRFTPRTITTIPFTLNDLLLEKIVEKSMPSAN